MSRNKAKREDERERGYYYVGILIYDQSMRLTILFTWPNRSSSATITLI